MEYTPEQIGEVMEWAGRNNFAITTLTANEVKFSSPTYYQGYEITAEELIELYKKDNE